MYSSEDKKEKTLVFVSNIPSAFKGVKILKALVKRNIPGGLLDGRILDGAGYALLLFDCVHTAVAACRASITWDVKVDTPALEAEAQSIKERLKSKNMNYDDIVRLQKEVGREVLTQPNGKSVIRYTFLLRVVEQEHKVVVEETHKSTLVIQGEVVEKSTLAMTLGLMDAYRGEKARKWCVHTKAKRDCKLGGSCNFIHLKAHQTTQKRAREFTADGAVLTGEAIAGGAAESGGRPRLLHELWDGRTSQLFEGCKVGAVADADRPSLLAPTLGSLPLTRMDLLLLVGDDGMSGEVGRLHQWLRTSCEEGRDGGHTSPFSERVAESLFSSAATAYPTILRLAKAVSLIAATKGVVPFLRLDSVFDGCTALSFYACPSELSFGEQSCSIAGLEELRCRGKAVLPRNGAPTPMERDGFIREVLLKRAVVSAMNNQYAMSAEDSVQGSFGALCLFLCAPGVVANLRAYLGEGEEGAPRVVVMPHYILGHVTQEYRMYVKNSRVVCVAQKWDNVLVEGGWLEISSTAATEGGVSPFASPSQSAFASFLCTQLQAAAATVESWLQTTQSRDVSCCIDLAFPRGIYGAGVEGSALPTDTSSLACSLPPSSSTAYAEAAGSNVVAFGQCVYAVPTASQVRPTPPSLHVNALQMDRNPLLSPPSDYKTSMCTPVILSVDTFDGAVASSTLYSHSAGTTRPANDVLALVSGHGGVAGLSPLWRRNRTSNQPIFSRDTVLNRLR